MLSTIYYSITIVCGSVTLRNSDPSPSHGADPLADVYMVGHSEVIVCPPRDVFSLVKRLAAEGIEDSFVFHLTYVLYRDRDYCLNHSEQRLI